MGVFFMFKENKYTRIYNAICQKSLARYRPEYPTNYAAQKVKKKTGLNFEIHHIVPKCLGGENATENVVYLTPREHFICHRLLCKMHDSPKLKFAFFSMTRSNKKQNRLPGDGLIEDAVVIYRMSRRYEIAKKHFVEAIKITNARCTLTPEGRKKKADFTKNNNPMTNPVFAARAARNHSKKYIVTLPDGKEIKVRNMAEFCRQNGLNRGNMCSVAKGNLNHYKGYKCRYA
jgi:hypothetical protein